MPTCEASNVALVHTSPMYIQNLVCTAPSEYKIDFTQTSTCGDDCQRIFSAAISDRVISPCFGVICVQQTRPVIFMCNWKSSAIVYHFSSAELS